MCGIFGAIGKPDAMALKFLCYLNQERGRQSTGLYNYDGNELGYFYRTTSSASEMLKTLDSEVFNNAKLLIGHTRQSTHGTISLENCHPFQIGNIIGAHNGIIYNHNDVVKDDNVKYEVDSQAIFHLLDKGKSLSVLRGYMGIAYADVTKLGTLFLSRFNCPVAVLKTADTIYFSSLEEHLKLLNLKGEYIVLEESKIYQFNPDLTFSIVGEYTMEKYSTVADTNTTSGGYDWSKYKGSRYVYRQYEAHCCGRESYKKLKKNELCWVCEMYSKKNKLPDNKKEARIATYKWYLEEYGVECALDDDFFPTDVGVRSLYDRGWDSWEC